jgi:microcystin-dependent protein
MIVMWGGLASAIPAGWLLCDGAGGRPDLRDRFIVGAGTSYAVGDTGGQNSVNLTSAMLPAHTHSFSVTANTTSAGAHTHSAGTTVSDPTHTHNPGVNIISSSSGSLAGYLPSGGGSPLYNTQIAGASTGISATTSVVSAANHLHSVTIAGNTSQTGANQSIDNRPLYYALCFIQKVY